MKLPIQVGPSCDLWRFEKLNYSQKPSQVIARNVVRKSKNAAVQMDLWWFVGQLDILNVLHQIVLKP